MSDQSLGERLRTEEEFHDKMAERDTRWTTFRAWGLSAKAIRYAKDLVGNLEDKTLVDMGCGDGCQTKDFIIPGATILAFDISKRMVEAARALLIPIGKEVGCSVCVQQMAAEQMTYPSESVDVIFGISILHHLELSSAIEEIKRVLKPGGQAIFLEPLAHHSLAKIYRALTPTRHSETERPLDYSIFDFLKSHFWTVDHKEFYLLSLLAVAFTLLRTRTLFNWSLTLFTAIDTRLMKLLPFTRKYAWLTVIEVVK